MGGAFGFIFYFAGGPVKDGVGCSSRGSGGTVLGAGRMSGCGGGGGPYAGSKVLKSNAG